MALIELGEVTRHVPLPTGEDLHILRGVNLRVEAGEHISIVGRSGTGKSTLLNIIGLLDQPSSGSYMVNGRDALKLGEGRRSSMRGTMFGFVFQQFNIFNARTAQENVEVPLLYTSGSQFWRRHDAAAHMLGRVGLEDRLDSYPTEMSGGEQQRIAIARALVRRPRIILADEPTGALDPDTGRSVMSLLEDVAAENDAALIVITHDLNVAVRADRVLSLYDGVLHTVDNPREVLVPTQIGAVAAHSDGATPVPADDAAAPTHGDDPDAPTPDNRSMPEPVEGIPAHGPRSMEEPEDVTRAGDTAVVVEEAKPPTRSLIKRWRKGRNGND